MKGGGELYRRAADEIERLRDVNDQSTAALEAAERRAEEAERLAEVRRETIREYGRENEDWSVRAHTAEQERNQYAAVVEKARLIVDRVPDGFWVDEVYELDNILNSVTTPDDALREVKAEAWQEGAYRVYNSTLDEAEWWWSDWANENPYRAREEQDR